MAMAQDCHHWSSPGAAMPAHRRRSEPGTSSKGVSVRHRRAWNVAVVLLAVIAVATALVLQGCQTSSKTWVDSDGDHVPDHVEQEIGSDPEDDDTDGDGLSDYVEIYLPGAYEKSRASKDASTSDAGPMAPRHAGRLIRASYSRVAEGDAADPVAPGSSGAQSSAVSADDTAGGDPDAMTTVVTSPSPDAPLPTSPETHDGSGTAVAAPAGLSDSDGDGRADVLDDDQDGDGANDGRRRTWTARASATRGR